MPRLEREVLFAADLFPDGPHEPEVLYRIGPLLRTLTSRPLSHPHATRSDSS